MQPSFYVRAIWDPEAEVWVSESDIPGLVIEAETLAEFEGLMTELAPEMLAINADIHNQQVSIDFSAASRRDVVVA